MTRICEHPPHLVLSSTECSFINKLPIHTLIIISFLRVFLTGGSTQGVLSPVLPQSFSGWPPLQGLPNLSSVSPATIPKLDETATPFTALTRICEHPPHLVLSSTDCSFINKLPIYTIIIFFNVFLTRGSTRLIFSWLTFFNSSLLHALCLSEPQTSLKTVHVYYCCMKHKCIMFCYAHSPPSCGRSTSSSVTTPLSIDISNHTVSSCRLTMKT